MSCVALYGEVFQIEEIVHTKDRRLGEYPVFKVLYKMARKASVHKNER